MIKCGNRQCENDNRHPSVEHVRACFTGDLVLGMTQAEYDIEVAEMIAERHHLVGESTPEHELSDAAADRYERGIRGAW